MKLKKFKEIDHKKRSVIIFTIICILLISGVFLYRTFAIFETNDKFNLIEGNVGSIGDITFSVYIDNELVKEVPEKGTKVFDSYHSYCENGSIISWNEHSWEASIKNLSNTKTKCHLKFISGYEESTLNGAIPDLGNGKLTPITIENNGIVKKADLTKDWYSYQNKEWANAVILKENSYELLNANGKIYGEPTIKEDSLYMDGINDYVDLGLENYDFKDQITMAITFKLNDINKYQSIFGNWDTGGGGIEYDNIKKALVNDFHINNEYKIINVPFNDTTSYHTVVLRYNGQKIEVWLDVQKFQTVYEVSGNVTIPKNTALAIGANPTVPEYVFTNFANMNVKQAAIFNRAISEDEIASISNENFRITNGEGLLKYVDFTNKEYEENEVIPEDNIESYFVWIPRYRYQIWNGDTDKYASEIASLSTTNALTQPEINQQKEIQIQFETNDVPISDGNIKNSWLTHPAFTSFNDSNGFWVGKFESGYEGAQKREEAQQNTRDSTKLIVKPNVYSWRSIQLANAFYTSYDYLRELESHMLKNMEWGAVAYLTQSKYGRCTNGNCPETRMNNSTDFITGMSAIKEPTCGNITSNTSCNPYEATAPEKDGTNIVNYKNLASQVSSTTGNYSGIYDMSGGSWEYVMMAMNYSPDSGIPASGQNASYNSGFNGPYSDSAGEITNGLPWPSKKYYDLYDYSSIDKNWNREHLGDATKETGPFYKVTYASTNRYLSTFYADLAHIFSAASPFLIRGGARHDGTGTGLFSSWIAMGHAHTDYSFRVIITP